MRSCLHCRQRDIARGVSPTWHREVSHVYLDVSPQGAHPLFDLISRVFDDGLLGPQTFNIKLDEIEALRADEPRSRVPSKRDST
jgi:hypothetical protein